MLTWEQILGSNSPGFWRKWEVSLKHIAKFCYTVFVVLSCSILKPQLNVAFIENYSCFFNCKSRAYTIKLCSCNAVWHLFLWNRMWNRMTKVLIAYISVGWRCWCKMFCNSESKRAKGIENWYKDRTYLVTHLVSYLKDRKGNVMSMLVVTNVIHRIIKIP